MPVGIVHSNTSPQSFLRLERDVLIYPLAASANYFSSATSGGAPGSFSLNGATVGTTVFLSAAGQKPLTYGRLVTVTITDVAAASCTVRVYGKRFGRLVTQDFVLAPAGPALITGAVTMDEVTSASIVALANTTNTGTIQIGFDGTRIGLTKPIRSLRDVKFVQKISAATPSTTGADILAGAALQTAANIELLRSSLVVGGASFFNAAIAPTDIYIVEYLVRGDEFTPLGRKFG